MQIPYVKTEVTIWIIKMTIMPTIETTKECGKLVEKGGLPLFEKIILRV